MNPEEGARRLPLRHRKALAAELRERLGTAEGHVLILPLCSRDSGEAVEIAVGATHCGQEPPAALDPLDLV